MAYSLKEINDPGLLEKKDIYFNKFESKRVNLSFGNKEFAPDIFLNRPEGKIS